MRGDDQARPWYPSAVARPAGPEGAAGDRLVLAGPLSLSGRYALQGRLAAAGLRQVVEDVRSVGGVRVGDRMLLPELLVLDDRGTRKGVRRILDRVSGADLLIGPYGSDLVAEAARVAAQRGRVLWNHGASADDVQRRPLVVSVPSPASRYAEAVMGAVAEGLPGAGVLLAVGQGAFGRGVAEGARAAAERLAMRVVGTMAHADVPDAPQADLLIAAGSFEDDLALVARLRKRPPAVAAVAAALRVFGPQLGDAAQGVLAPSQWEEGARFRVDVGPGPMEVVRSLRAAALATLRAEPAGPHVDYPAAQAYATGVVAMRCVERAGALEDRALYEAAWGLRCTTFFGRFGLGEDGRQADHEVLVVQWQEGVKRVVWPPSVAEAPLAL